MSKLYVRLSQWSREIVPDSRSCSRETPISQSSVCSWHSEEVLLMLSSLLYVTSSLRGVQCIVMSMSVRLSTRISQKPRGQTPPNVLCMLPVAVAQSSSDISRCNSSWIHSFVDAVMFSRNCRTAHHAFLIGIKTLEHKAEICSKFC